MPAVSSVGHHIASRRSSLPRPARLPAPPALPGLQCLSNPTERVWSVCSTGAVGVDTVQEQPVHKQEARAASESIGDEAFMVTEIDARYQRFRVRSTVAGLDEIPLPAHPDNAPGVERSVTTASSSRRCIASASP